MSLFVEVFSLEKNCPVILNLDSVLEIAPVTDGSTAIFFADSAAVSGRTSIKVRDSYNMFKQFVIQPVSAEDIARRFPKATAEKEQSPVVLETPPQKTGKQVLDEKKAALKGKTGSQGPSTTTSNLG